LHYLASWWDILKLFKDEGTDWSNETLSQIEQFLTAPLEWSKQNT